MTHTELPSGDKKHLKNQSMNLPYALLLLFMFVLLCLSVEQLSAFFMTEESYHWFQLLNKPTWTPASFVFPLVWTILYVMMAFAVWIVWHRHQLNYRRAILIWFIQLALNALWTPVFFAQQQIFYGLILIYFLWMFVLLTTIVFYKHSKVAFFLMVPYLLWTSFAGVLNFVIWQMNS